MLEINFLLLIEFIILAIVCFFLIRYYKGHMVTWDVSITVYISWVLGFAGILLLPYDLSVAEVEDLQSKYLYELWNLIYWSTFILAWIVLPLQLEYHNSGHFTFSSKLKDAIRKNLLSLGLAGLGGTIYIIYMVASGNGSPMEVVSFMMAMGNTYGVLIIIFLMGNGLISLPRRLWQIGDSEAELIRLYLSSGGVESAYQEARYELEDCELEVTKISKWLDTLGVNSKEVFELGPLISILNNSISNFQFAGRSNSLQYVNNSTKPHSLEGVDSKAILVNLRARLLNAQIKARACERRWHVLLKKVKRFEKLLNGETIGGGDKWCEQRMEIGSIAENNNTISKKICKTCRLLYESTTTIISSIGLKHICRFLSILCAIFSAIILWSELVMTTNLHSPIGIIIGAYDKNPEKDNIVLVQIVSFLALSYMSICTYLSLFRINLGWSYTLQGPQLSPPSSLIFNGEYFSRLQFSLGYNFLLILNANGSTSKTSFSLLMSNITLIPIFGSSFIVYVPILIILIALISLFNCMSRLLRFVGVESDDSFSSSKCCSNKNIMNEEDQNLYESGKKLVNSAIRLMARNKEDVVNPTHDNNNNNSNGRLTKLREKYETINRSNDNNDIEEDDEISIELTNLQRIEGGMNRLSSSSSSSSSIPQTSKSNFFSGINNALSLSYNYEKIDKNNVQNPVHNSTNNRNKDFSFEEDDDTNKYTGRYG